MAFARFVTLTSCFALASGQNAVWEPTDLATASDPWTRAVGCWVQRCVVGLELCPWASASVENRGMRVVVSDGDADAVLACVRDELALLAALTDVERATTLIASTRAFARFDDFLAGAEQVEALIERSAAAAGAVQLATFHPEYRFAGTKKEDASNYTNRSPLPIYHLLREREVAQALSGGRMDRDDVWERNVARTRALGRTHMRRLVESCRPRLL
jgi:hypothetical protein